MARIPTTARNGFDGPTTLDTSLTGHRSGPHPHACEMAPRVSFPGCRALFEPLLMSGVIVPAGWDIDARSFRNPLPATKVSGRCDTLG